MHLVYEEQVGYLSNKGPRAMEIGFSLQVPPRRELERSETCNHITTASILPIYALGTPKDTAKILRNTSVQVRSYRNLEFSVSLCTKRIRMPPTFLGDWLSSYEPSKRVPHTFLGRGTQSGKIVET